MPMRQHAAVPGRPIAFVCAMPMELVPLTRDLGLVETDVDGQTVHRGQAGDHDLVAVVTGMGTELATAGTERLLAAFDVQHVLVVGITGALENDTPIGTLVLPEVVVHGPSGREHRHDPVGGHAHAGQMWTSDELITDSDRLVALRARGVVSLDMETAAIAHVCERRGVRWSVFRAISDRASDGTIDPEVFAMSNLDGTPNHEAIAAYFDRHPDKAALLAEMGANATTAADAAAAAAIAALEHL
jgi:adenosylhomocysteine nucleosidase